MTLIVKILGLVGAIFCGICLILPWAGISMLGSGMSLYSWGTSTYLPTASVWDFFFINSISTGVTENIILSVVMIVAFILTIIALITGILGVVKIGKKPSNSMLTAGILSIIAVILCVIAVTQANALINQIGFSGIALGFGAGFFLIVIAMILYFVTFALQKIFITSPMPGAYQQPMYQQPQYGQQPQVMYTQTQQPPAQQTPPPQAPPVQQTPPPQQPQTPPPAQTPPPPPAKTDQPFCPDCGTKLLANSKFCPSCGKQI